MNALRFLESLLFLLIVLFSHVRLFCHPMEYIACQAPLSMESSRQEYWSRLPIPFSRGSSQAQDQTWVSRIAGRFFTTSAKELGLGVVRIQPVIGSKTYCQVSVLQGSKNLSQSKEASLPRFGEGTTYSLWR